MTDRTADILTSRWTAVPNDEIGGWALSTNGRTPASGGVMAADMVWSRQVAEHIAELHNQWVTQHLVTVRPATAVVRGTKHKVTPLAIPAEDHKDFLARWRAAMAMWPNRPDEEVAACPSRQPWICTPADCPGCANEHCWVQDPHRCRHGCDVAPRTSESQTQQ